MKVISQLVRHFWQRGVLTPQEVNYLIEHGFVRPRDLPGYQSLEGFADEQNMPWGNQEVASHPDAFEEFQERLVRRSSRGRRAPRGKVLEVKDLCERVDAEFAHRQDAFDDLITLARRMQGKGAAGDWTSAAVLLRQVSEKRFHRDLSAALRDGSVNLRRLWQALDLEPFHHLLDDVEVRGRAAHAYVALLVARDAGALGKYGWILHHDAMQHVNNLRVANARLLLGLNRMYRRDPRILTHALNAGCDPIPFWSLLLVHNAYRLSRNDGQPHPAREYGPVPQPDDETWRQAWTGALGMDRQPVTHLLVECYRDAGERRKRSVVASTQPLYCPVGWHVPDISA
jgi:hypothetical protein